MYTNVLYLWVYYIKCCIFFFFVVYYVCGHYYIGGPYIVPDESGVKLLERRHKKVRGLNIWL